MIFKNAKIVLEDKIIENGWIEIDSKIKSINSGSTIKEGKDLKGKIIFPGFIDCHVHGGYGNEFENATFEAFNLFAKNIAKEGVTSFCQATVTQPVNIINKALSIYAEWFKKENKGAQARQIGAHLEGPFISASKKGAHSEELLSDTNIKVMQNWIKLSGKNIKLITYAIERDKDNFTKFLVKNNIIPSVGHSNCSAEEFITKGVKNGAKHITHLFNGMSTVSHFTKGNGQIAGLATGAMIDDSVLCELISDGIHINKETVQLVYKVKGPDGICLITDAMQAKGLKDGEYKLGPLTITKLGQSAKLKGTNILAGSVATYDHCFRTFKSFTGASLLAMTKVCSVNIAKQLGIFSKTGSITVGKNADLVILDKTGNVLETIVEGQIAYKK